MKLDLPGFKNLEGLPIGLFPTYIIQFRRKRHLALRAWMVLFRPTPGSWPLAFIQSVCTISIPYRPLSRSQYP
ncbi:hypothetical protein Mettu_1725 [Methylobacter tundripaludum SV96]|uniref:Uncharacterized protein n=1 Tax=Methylobacter tundripaludum (strain ATCC BAA-1195 / DSM 17260 / SV96) TaxID=697282 RepID=G3IVG5_METTV|nr:hypothetical protein Mettu_1725 [Methylobacter tundripaludum SV96]